MRYAGLTGNQLLFLYVIVGVLSFGGWLWENWG